MKTWLPHRLRKKYWLENYALAIVTGVFMIIIIPACGVFWLFLRQETALQHNSGMLNTGLAIAQRNLLINETLAPYKFFGTGPGSQQTPFGKAMTDLKSRDGIYLVQDRVVDIKDAGGQQPDHSTAPEYERMHRLFFPRDSTELAWADTSYRAKDRSWRFVYQAGNGGDPQNEHFNKGRRMLEVFNPQDGIDTPSIKMSSGPGNSFSSVRLMTTYVRDNGIAYIILYFGSQFIGLLLIYWLTISLARRIFLLKLFDGTLGSPVKRERLSWLLGIYGPQPAPQAQKMSPASHTIPLPPPPTIWQIGTKERSLFPDPYAPDQHAEEAVLGNRSDFDAYYREVWKGLLPMEKFVLYDFALDGFTNYKTADTLYSLYDQGLLCFDEGNRKLVFMTLSFREWVLQHCDDPDITSLMKEAATKGPWQSFKLPLLILLAAFGLFIFFTQDALYQKLAGLVASGTSMANMLIPFLKKAGGKPAAGDQ